ncbi:MAG: hypothetical protein ACU841_11445 [Gammaproteobacteria bacterium]
MKRNDPIFGAGSTSYPDLIRQAAFHEAGHAAGIHIYNRSKQLPPVAFQIRIQKPDVSMEGSLDVISSDRTSFVAEVEGGRLIPELPAGLIESAQYFSTAGADAYQSAFEADMINLLIGSLAEAKHVALRDYGYFDPKSVTLLTLHHFGGSSDLDEFHRSLENTIACRRRQEEKIAALFGKALDFIADPGHWQATERLALYILDHKDAAIDCGEAIAVLEAAH